MKKLSLMLISSAMIFNACSSSKMTSRDYDDVYYSSKDQTAERYDNEQSNQSSNQSANQTNTDYSGSNPDRFSNSSGYDQPSSSSSSNFQGEDGNTYVTNNYYYEDDDYYDYAYTARIRRFHHPVGWSYYDSYYTNLYWYDYNPFNYGVSLYCTYPWWGPSTFWGPSISFNWGWNYGYSNCGFGWGGYYNNGWNGYNHGYWNGYNNGYWNGYNNGYWNGYYAGLYNGSFNPYYFNSFDSYSYYYGPRGGRNSIASNTPRGGKNLSELYGKSVTDQVSNHPKNGGKGQEEMQAFGRPKNTIGSTYSGKGDNIEYPKTKASEYASPQPKNNSVNQGENASPKSNYNNVPSTGSPSTGSGAANPRNNQEYSTPRNNQEYSNPRNNQEYSNPRNNQEYSNPRNNQEYSNPKIYNVPSNGSPSTGSPSTGSPSTSSGAANPRNNQEYSAPRNQQPKSRDGGNAPKSFQEQQSPRNNNFQGGNNSPKSATPSGNGNGGNGPGRRTR